MANVPLKSLVFPGLDPTYTVPQKTSDLTNDSGFITEDDAPSTADFDALSETVTGEIDRFNKSQLVPVDWAPSLIKGAYWKQSDGTSASSNKYCRTSNGWAGFNTRVAIKLDNAAYTFGIALYDENNGYLGYVPYKTGISYLPTNAYYFGISVNRQDNGNLTDADITAIGAALSAYAFTDKSLTQSNYPADAKEVGDALAAKAPAVTEVTVSTAGAVTQAMDAGKIYHFTGAVSALTLTLNAAATGQIAQYHFDFDSGSTAPMVTLPNSVTMQGGTFTPEANKHYEVDILNGYGVYVAW